MDSWYAYCADLRLCRRIQVLGALSSGGGGKEK